MRVLVTGGAGYIGSHAVRELLDRQHKVFVLDDLSHGHLAAIDGRADFTQGRTGDSQKVTGLLKTHAIEAVMHFAADIEVGESVTNPAKYYENNFVNALSLLNSIRECSVKKFIFSSTAAVYGNPEKTPIEETAVCKPINPYGRTKLMVELVLEDFRTAYGLGYAILRYFNVAGAHPSGEIGEDHRPETHLIPRILASASQNSAVKIYGTDYSTPDGTCIRDYVHVSDLARAHSLALDAVSEARGEVYNVGSENGFSVREVVTACGKVTGRKLTILNEPRRAGDPDILVASSAKIRSQLSWRPEYENLETIIEHAWKWHQTHPQGFVTGVPK